MRACGTGRYPLAVAIGALLLVPTPAAAHLVGVEFGDFYGGVLHLATAPADVSLLLALGALAGMQRPESARWSLATLPLGLLLGLLLAVLGPGMALTSEAAAGTALCIGLAGLAAAAAVRMPGALLAAFAGVAGAILGLSNGIAAIPARVDWILYGGGVLIVGTFLGTMAIAISTALAAWRSEVRLGQRVIGSWFGAAGTIVFALVVSV
ncbi:MAG: HupE/UreJ family protein [Pseudomonadota bacterium]